MIHIKLIFALLLLFILLKILGLIDLNHFFQHGVPIVFIFLFVIAFTEEIKKVAAEIVNFTTNRKNNFKREGGVVGYTPINEEHVAILFPTVYEFDYPNVYGKEIKPLIEHYKESSEKYEIYLCYQVDDFINIVKSPKVTGLHIFGHGKIYKLKFKDGGIYYREFYGLEHKKDFVCQWHCNIGKYRDKHLGFIAKKYYVPIGLRHRWNNIKDIKKFIEDTLDWKYN